MRKRGVILVVLACLAATAALIAILSPKHESEPTYQGRPLSKLIEESDCYFGSRDRHARELAVQGVREIGTNAIPFLLRWIQHEEPAWKDTLRSITGRFTERRLPSVDDLNRANNLAPHAFATLGPSGDAAIPELTRLALQTNRHEIAVRAVVALCYSARPQALPPLLTLLTNRASLQRTLVADTFYLLGTNALPALAGLISTLDDPDEMVAKSAAYSLGELKFDPQLVVPVLMAAAKPQRPIVNRFALGALGKYGTNATDAIPLLLQNLSSADEGSRSSATNALKKISPEALAKATAP